MTDRWALRSAAALLFAGTLLSLVAGLFHPGHEVPNDHAGAFAEYAASAHWTAIHLGQFAGMVVVIAGFLLLAFALEGQVGPFSWAGRLGAVSAVVALALYAALQAVDGVALKQAVDAWARAPEAEKAARFASAESIRWLEWAVRSYQSFMLGLAFILVGMAVASTTVIPKGIGYLMALSGVAYLAQGWVLGVEGFSTHNALPTLLGIVLVLTWTTWLVIAAFKSPEFRRVPV